MKVNFWCDSGENIHSCRRETVDTEVFGFTDSEWLAASADEKFKVAEEWAWEKLDIGYEEAN